MTTWFTSDLHVNHKKIVDYTNRPTTAEQHVDWIRSVWNSQVKPGDTVYHLGDFFFGGSKKVESMVREFIDSLHGHKVFLKGNHCDGKLWRKLSEHYEFHKYKEITVEGQHICLFHFPLYVWHKQNYGAWHLHGHVHGRQLGIPGKILDVGIDNHPEHRLFSFAEIKEIMSAKQAEINDGRNSHMGEM